jgi:uncharacterized protein (TIGR03000 family)
MVRSRLVLIALAALVGPVLAAPPPGPAAGPPPLFGSPGSVGSPQVSYPAPGVYGSTVFQPFAMPSLSSSPGYNVPLPPPNWRDDFAAKVTVRLPADAKLWVDGKPTKQTGPVREFVTPPVLRPGQAYQYTFKAEWTDGGKTVTRERPVAVRATAAVAVDFAKP